ncbi:TPA: hypothetical protein ME697_001615, partial [Klebsiella pneumoniae]|nr:hypothetical protein [Klebsiella pneumoniae]
MTLNKRTLGTILIFAFPVCLYQMFNIIWIDKQIAKLLYFLILTFVIIYVFPNLFRIKKHSKYEVPLRFLFITMWISIACAFLFWGQDVILSYRSSATYFGIVFFFLLMKEKPDVTVVEKLIWFYCIVFILLWLYGMHKAPQIIYAIDAETTMDNSRGIFRLALPGRGFLILGFFVAVSKYIETKKTKWAVLFSILFVFIIFQVTRQIIIFSFLVSAIYILRKSKVALFVLFLGAIFILFSDSFI